MKLNVDGIVLSDQMTVNNKRLLTILTRENGIIRCFLHDGKDNGRNFGAAISVLCYSHFSFYKGKMGYTLDEAVKIEFFYKLMYDLQKLSLAQYFCEVAMYSVPEGRSDPEILSLLLNSLYVLNNDKKPELMVKAVFELRFAAISGYMPNVVGCMNCGVYEAEKMYFDFDRASLVCGNCPRDENCVLLSKYVLLGLRTAVLADPKKIFSFAISGNDIAALADIAEYYLLRITERSYRSLDYYKNLRQNTD